MAKFTKRPAVAPLEKPTDTAAEPDAPALTGSPKGYTELAERTRVGAGAVPSFLNDPAVREALKGDREIEKEIEAAETDELLNIEELLTDLENEPTGGHPFANGASIPFPYNGFDTVNFHTCSKPKKDENRGCPLYWQCPLRDRGPYLMAYLNKRARNQIRQITCIDFLKSNMVFHPWIVLLPGIHWEGTLEAEYTPGPDGKLPALGPGVPKTPIRLKAVKSMLPEELFAPAELVKEYTRLRRRGEIKQWQ
jgi:hypothetical protein